MPKKILFGPGQGAKLIEVTLTQITNVSGSYSGTTSDDRVTENMKPVLLELGNEDVFRSKITVTTGAGFVTISCPDVQGTSTAKVTLQKIASDPTAVTTTEFDILANRIGALSSLTTTEKGSAVGAINELVSNKQDKTDNSLNTTDKTVVGAINEHESDITTLNNNLDNKMDFDWEKGIDLDTFGQEYLGAFYTKAESNLNTYKILFSGDSTFAENKGTVSAVDGLFKFYMELHGQDRGTYYNTAVSGATASDWVANTLNNDITIAPDLYIIRYGLNNEAGNTDEERANNYYTVMDNALTTIRNSLPVSSCSIVLCMPSSSNDEVNNRGYSMHKALEPKVRSLARKHGCAFIDLFRTWYDAGPLVSNMYDNPFGDGRHIHPNLHQNRNISSKLLELVLPITLRGYNIIRRVVTSSTVAANGGIATIPLPTGYSVQSIKIVNAMLYVGNVAYYYPAANVEYVDSSGIHVKNNGGASGYIYVDYA